MQEYKAPVIELFKMFRSQYSGLANNLVDPQTMLLWIKDLSQADIPPEKVVEFGHAVRLAPEFQQFPPNNVQFIAFCTESMNVQDDDTYPASRESCELLIKRLSLRYGNAWNNNPESVSYFKTEISESFSTAFDVQKVESMIRSDDRFSSFPPNVDQIIFLIRLALSELEIIPVNQCYDYAIKQTGPNTNPFISEARRRFGGMELKTGKSGYARQSFENVYEKVIVDYLDGKINFEKTAKLTPKEQEFTEHDRKKVISTLDSLISKFS